MIHCVAVRMCHRMTNWRHNGAPQECNLIHQDESEIVMHKGVRWRRAGRGEAGGGGGGTAQLMRLLCQALLLCCVEYSLPGQPLV